MTLQTEIPSTEISGVFSKKKKKRKRKNLKLFYSVLYINTDIVKDKSFTGYELRTNARDMQSSDTCCCVVVLRPR